MFYKRRRSTGRKIPWENLTHDCFTLISLARFRHPVSMSRWTPKVHRELQLGTNFDRCRKNSFNSVYIQSPGVKYKMTGEIRGKKKRFSQIFVTTGVGLIDLPRKTNSLAYGFNSLNVLVRNGSFSKVSKLISRQYEFPSARVFNAWPA